jgi:hypothetical protein
MPRERRRKRPEQQPSASSTVLPRRLKVGVRFTDETGEWEIVGG